MSNLVKTALLIRNEIMSMEYTVVPNDITIESILQGNKIIPPFLNKFINCLYLGAKENKKIYKRQISHDSLALDVIYVVSNSQITNWKHISLVFIIKSLSGSKNLVQIFNKFGHCISYNRCKEIETELVYTQDKKSSLLPNEIIKSNECSLRVSYNNLDRIFVEI